MTLQRQHLEAIAVVIRDLEFQHGTRTRGEVAEHFAQRFEDDNVCGYDVNGNRKFSRARFLKACGVAD